MVLKTLNISTLLPAQFDAVAQFDALLAILEPHIKKQTSHFCELVCKDLYSAFPILDLQVQ